MFINCDILSIVNDAEQYCFCELLCPVEIHTILYMQSSPVAERVLLQAKFL